MSNRLDPDHDQHSVRPDLGHSRYKLFAKVISKCLLTLFKINFSKKFFQEHYQGSNRLDQDLDPHSVNPDLGTNCLQRLSVDIC